MGSKRMNHIWKAFSYEWSSHLKSRTDWMKGYDVDGWALENIELMQMKQSKRFSGRSKR